MRRRTFLGAAAAASTTATTVLNSTDAVAATGPTLFGNGVLIESFRQGGFTDDQTFAAAFSYAAAQTYKPTLILGAQEYELSNTYAAYKGLSLFGFGVEREFESASSWDSVYCRVYKHGSGPLFTWPSTGNFTSMRVAGIQFEGNQNGGSDFLAPTPTGQVYPALAMSTFEKCGWKNFESVMLGVNWEGVTLKEFHVQNCKNTAFKVGGADSFILGGHGFLDSQSLNNVPMFWLTDMTATTVSDLYITPTGAGCAIRYDAGSMTQFRNLILDSASQNGQAAVCHGSLIQINGGSSTITGGRLHGCMVNPAATDDGAAKHKGYITVNGGQTAIIGTAFCDGADRSAGGSSADYTPAHTPHVYAQTGARVITRGLLSVRNNPLVITEATSGLIDCDQPAALSVG